jgi:protoporphyrinogen oxidase
MNITILGGGISAISLAYFVQNSKKIKNIYIIEKDKNLGGLLRSYKFDKIYYDVGPHIIFSKHKDILKLNVKILGKNLSKIKRSNKILFQKKYIIKYPFENELSKLPQVEKDYALKTFLNNPFKKYNPSNMLQFFLKTFGSGITNLYLRPYNQKIWKYDPCFMDTQMVERIPRPPDKDIIKSAMGASTEGYKHQLFFYYPNAGGIETLFEAFKEKLSAKVKIYKNFKIEKILIKNKQQLVTSKYKKIKSDKIFSTIPLNNFYSYFKKNKKIKYISNELLFNSIKIIMVKLEGNKLGNNFAFLIPDKDIIFHRVSKLNFLGKNYSDKNSTYLQIEVTFRKGDHIDKMNFKTLKDRVISDLTKIKFIDKKNDIKKFQIKSFKFAYVIYDLDHRKNVDYLLNEYKKKGIYCLGRWGSWEYLNSDQVIKQSKNIARKLKFL